MRDDVDRELQQLDLIDLWLVVAYWRVLLWKRRAWRLSLPVKTACLTTVFLFGCLVALPPREELPPIIIPILWAGAYCAGLSIALLLPRPTPHER